MMRKLALLFFSLFAVAASAQNVTTYGTITAASATCTPTSCVYFQLPPNTLWAVVTVSGTWSGTLQAQTISSATATYQNLNSQTWTLAATLTSNNSVSVAVANATFILVNASAWSSGTAAVTIAASDTGTPMVNPVFPGQVTGSGLTAPNGGSALNCWLTNGTNGPCPGSAGAISATAGQVLAASGTQNTPSTAGGPASLPYTCLAANTVLSDYSTAFNNCFALSGTLNWTLPQGVFDVNGTVTLGQNGFTLSGQAWGQNDFNPHPTNITATSGVGGNPIFNLYATGNGFNGHLSNLTITGNDTAAQTGINVTGSVLTNSTWNVLEVDHVAVENVPQPWLSSSIGNSLIHDCFMQGDANSTGYLMDFGGTHGQNNVTVRDCYGNGAEGADSGSAAIAPALGFLWFEEGTNLHAWLNDVDGIAGPEVRCGNTSLGYNASCELHLKNNEIHRGPMVYVDRFSNADITLGTVGNSYWLGPAVEFYTGAFGQVHFTNDLTQLNAPPISVTAATTGGATLSGTVYVCVYADNASAVIPDGSWTGDWHNSCSSAVGVTLTGGQNSVTVTVPVVYSTANNSGITYQFAYGVSTTTANMNVVKSQTGTAYTILGTETPITNPPGQSNGTAHPPVSNIPTVTLATASSYVTATCPEPVSGAASTTTLLGWNYDASPFNLCGTGIVHSSTAGGAPSRGPLNVGWLDAESCPPGSTNCSSTLYVTEDNYASSVESNPLDNLLAQQVKINGTVCSVNGTGSANLTNCTPTAAASLPATYAGSANATVLNISDTGTGSGVMQENVVSGNGPEIPLLVQTAYTTGGGCLIEFNDSYNSITSNYCITNSGFNYPHTFQLFPTTAAISGTNQSSPQFSLTANVYGTSGATTAIIGLKSSVTNTPNTPVDTLALTTAAGTGVSPTYAVDLSAAAAGTTVAAVNQLNASSFGGTCAMSTGTSCTITIAHTFTTPVCIATQQSATLTGGAVGCTVSGTTVTITSAVANSETWGAFVFGNPK